MKRLLLGILLAMVVISLVPVRANAYLVVNKYVKVYPAKPKCQGNTLSDVLVEVYGWVKITTATEEEDGGGFDVWIVEEDPGLYTDDHLQLVWAEFPPAPIGFLVQWCGSACLHLTTDCVIYGDSGYADMGLLDPPWEIACELPPSTDNSNAMVVDPKPNGVYLAPSECVSTSDTLTCPVPVSIPTSSPIGLVLLVFIMITIGLIAIIKMRRLPTSHQS